MIFIGIHNISKLLNQASADANNKRKASELACDKLLTNTII